MAQNLPKHDCEKVLQRVQLALDGELTHAEEKAFLSELDACNCCLTRFQIEETFKKFLTEKIRCHEMNQSNKEKIMANLYASIRAEE